MIKNWLEKLNEFVFFADVSDVDHIHAETDILHTESESEREWEG